MNEVQLQSSFGCLMMGIMGLLQNEAKREELNMNALALLVLRVGIIKSLTPFADVLIPH